MRPRHVEMIDTICWCGTPFSMPAEMYNHAKRNGSKFYCPHGHNIVFKISDADKYRQEAERLRQRLAEKDDDIRHERNLREQRERSIVAYRGQVTKLRKRAAAGVCPCCNRSFVNLKRHMASKHPNYVEQDLTVIEGGKVS